MNTRTPALLGMITVASIATAFAWSQVTPEHTTSRPHHINTTQAVKVYDPINARCRVQTGEQAAFEFNTQATPMGLAKDKDVVTDQLKGILSWTVQNNPESGPVELRVALSDVSWDQQLTKPQERLAPKVLERHPFILRMNDRCQFVGVGFSSAWPEPAKEAVRTLLGSFEMVFSDEHTSPVRQWRATQKDGMGTYASQYRQSPQSDTTLTVQRIKSHYSLTSSSTMGVRVQVAGAVTTARFDTKQPGWFQHIKGQERIQLTLPGATNVRFLHRFEITRRDERFVPVATLATQDATFHQNSAQTTNHITKDARLVGISRQQALKHFHTKHGSADGMHGAALWLAKWLKSNPDGAGMLLADYRAGKFAEGVRASLFLALELAGTSESRAVLVDVLKDGRGNELDRTRSAIALSQHGKPSSEVSKVLLDQAQRNTDNPMVRNASILGIGTLAQRAHSDETLSGDLRKMLDNELSRQQGKDVEVIVVDALGNTQDDHFAKALGARLNDPRAMMRARAAEALSHLSASVARPYLSQRLAIETDERVRLMIVRSLSSFGKHAISDSALTIAAQRLSTSTAINERIAIIDWLANSGDALARQVIINHFPNEPSAQIQRHIGKYFSATALQGG